jgi:hypothetical protein
MRELRLEDFSAAVGETFSVELDGTAVPLSLAAAQELPRMVREAGSFRLDWLGPSEPMLPQAIYRMRRGEETFEMFIVPVAKDGAGVHYEAIFN